MKLRRNARPTRGQRLVARQYSRAFILVLLVLSACFLIWPPPIGRTWNATFESLASGTIINEDTAGLYGYVFAENSASSTRAMVQADPSNSANKVLGMSLPAPTGGVRNRVHYRRTAQTFNLGDTAWVGMRYRVGNDWDLSSSQTTDSSSTFSVIGGYRWGADNGPGLGGTSIQNSGGIPYFVAKRTKYNTDYPDGKGEAPVRLKPVRKGVWLNFVTKTKFTTQAGSKTREWWFKYDDEAEWSYYSSDILTIASSQHTFEAGWWVGLYQGPGINHRRTVHWDNQRFGASFTDVDPSR